MVQFCNLFLNNLINRQPGILTAWKLKQDDEEIDELMMILFFLGLSHGVVRVDQDNSLTSLTLQDCGQVLPGAKIVIVRWEI